MDQDPFVGVTEVEVVDKFAVGEGGLVAGNLRPLPIVVDSGGAGVFLATAAAFVAD